MKRNKVNNKLTFGGVTQHCRLYCTFCFTVISNVTFFGNLTEFGQVVLYFSWNNVSASIINNNNFFMSNKNTKIWGENWLYLRPYLKAFPVFNVLKTCREYFLTIDLGIIEFIKKFIERFLGKCEIIRHGPNYVQKLYQKQLNVS